MKKNILIFFIIFFIFLQNLFACDPMGCVMSGQNEDALLIVETKKQVNNNIETIILSVYPQTKLKSLKSGQKIFIKNKENKLFENKYYLVSLYKIENNLFEIAWDFFELSSSDYKKAKIINKNKYPEIDIIAWNYFIQSRGGITEFSFNYGEFEDGLTIKNFKVITVKKNKNIIFSKNYFIFIIIFSFSLLFFTLLLLKKSKK